MAMHVKSLCAIKAPWATKGSFSKWMATAANSGLFLMCTVQMSALESHSLRQICLPLHWASHHITVASLSTELNTNICLTVFALQLKGEKTLKGTVIAIVHPCYVLYESLYLPCVTYNDDDHCGPFRFIK